MQGWCWEIGSLIRGRNVGHPSLLPGGLGDSGEGRGRGLTRWGNYSGDNGAVVAKWGLLRERGWRSGGALAQGMTV